MSASRKPKRRCAIYVRKSTCEGLEDEITSLDVQRQAGEAYIQSQAQEGWVCLTERYDDGGFSGADLKRPAVERLLSDIEAGQVDIVVVYKVDRLSRSLLDFARLVSVFDRHGVAFVAVTQQFNTSDSMGRLTLNVLLSFAQFERELIAERTRDKMAMARRRGRWTGGTPVLGYDLSDGQLAVNQKEAKRVRNIFELYLKSGSLAETVGQLDRRRWRTKRWTTKKGRQRGGRHFRKSSLHQLLTNITYRGQVRYKQAVYQGQHESIVNEELFERVQQCLAERRLYRRCPTGNQRRVTLLEGFLYCGGCGSPMAATYTTRGSRRYRYYVCRKSGSSDGEVCSGVTLPAAEIERFLIAAVLPGMADDAHLSSEEEREQVSELVERVEYDAACSQLTIHWNEATGRETLIRKLHFRTGRHGRKQLSDEAPPVEQSATESVPRLARLMALALRLEGLVRDGRVSDYAELARLGRVSRARLSQILSLTLLAPDIQERLLLLPGGPSGRGTLTERQLRPIAAEPDWQRQRRLWQRLPVPRPGNGQSAEPARGR